METLTREESGPPPMVNPAFLAKNRSDKASTSQTQTDQHKHDMHNEPHDIEAIPLDRQQNTVGNDEMRKVTSTTCKSVAIG